MISTGMDKSSAPAPAADADVLDLIRLLQERFEDPCCIEVEEMLGIMSNALRYRILCALRVHPFTPNQLVEITGGRASNVSQQLSILLIGDYVTRQREGRVVRYRLKQDRTRKLIRLIEDMYALAHLDDVNEKKDDEEMTE